MNSKARPPFEKVSLQYLPLRVIRQDTQGRRSDASLGQLRLDREQAATDGNELSAIGQTTTPETISIGPHLKAVQSLN
jgi:hypothetical protein